MKPSQSPSTRSSLQWLWLIALPLLVAVYIQRKLQAVPPPPSDFGDGRMFDAIAARYDVINRVLALGMDIGWRQEMVDIIQSSLKEQERAKVLDVATGTADVAILLARTLSNAMIIGVDPSPKMLEIGQDKIQQRNLTDQIVLNVADARQLDVLQTDLALHSIDAATMAFGIRNVPPQDRSDALCQVHALLKPGAIFAIMEFAEPANENGGLVHGIMAGLARLFVRYLVPVVGTLLSGRVREYWHLQHSIQDFPSPHQFAAQLASVTWYVCRVVKETMLRTHSASTSSSDHFYLLCSGDSDGQKAFVVKEVRHLNWGTVQLYVLSTAS
jgi:demethylmenaquinone methyltransferase / 2-methoxy-6-polyprenyl-1,4-benzoquinol methylase